MLKTPKVWSLRLNLSSKISAGGGFEWDDDFSSPAPAFLPKKDAGLPSKSSSSPFSSPPQAAGRPSEPSWSSSSSYSRFSISPASIASFSLTHLTDSDIEQGGAYAPGWRFYLLTNNTYSYANFKFL